MGKLSLFLSSLPKTFPGKRGNFINYLVSRNVFSRRQPRDNFCPYGQPLKSYISLGDHKFHYLHKITAKFPTRAKILRIQIKYLRTLYLSNLPQFDKPSE
jgi:hypothetical protein